MTLQVMRTTAGRMLEEVVAHIFMATPYSLLLPLLLLLYCKVVMLCAGVVHHI
jgi:hypothetical protein